jgi:hypothetical protein
MKIRRRALPIAAAMLYALAQCSAWAQSLPASLLDCSTERDDARRLACYDREVTRLRDAAQPAAVDGTSAAAAAIPATAPASDGDKFGKREDKPPKEKALTATVTEVRSKPYGELVVTLDNGQVWSEIAANSGLRVKVGDQVRIEPGALNSYLLVPPGGRAGKVKRIK